jgi:hypothetical protein
VAGEIFKQQAIYEDEYITSFMKKHPTSQAEIDIRDVNILSPHRKLAVLYREKADALSALFFQFPLKKSRRELPLLLVPAYQ